MEFKIGTRSIVAGALLALAGGAASAATTSFEEGSPTLSVGDFVLANTVLDGGGDSEIIEFTALENLMVSQFLLTGNGANGGEDLMDVTFGYTRSDGTSASDTFFDIIVGNGGTNAIGLGALDGFTLAAAETFFFTYDYSGVNNLDVDLSFTTAEIPVPAAAGLLAGALSIAGVVGRKKKVAKA